MFQNHIMCNTKRYTYSRNILVKPHTKVLISYFPSECAAPNVDPAKIASYLTATAIPTSNIVYKCDDGYSFERPKADQRNEVEKACSYSSSSSTVALDQSQEQCLSKQSFNF